MYSLLVMIGSVVFCIGPYFKNFWIMIVGRFIFGLGAESSYVAQDTITAMWFQGKELAMAMGVVGSAGRLGEFFSYLVLPILTQEMKNYVYGFWIASALCMVAMVACLAFIALDMQAESYLRGGEEEASGFSFRAIKDFGVSYWLITFISITYYSSIFPFQAFCPNYLQSKFHYSDKEASELTSVIYCSYDSFSFSWMAIRQIWSSRKSSYCWKFFDARCLSLAWIHSKQTSGHSFSHDDRNCIFSGFCGHLALPFLCSRSKDVWNCLWIDERPS